MFITGNNCKYDDITYYNKSGYAIIHNGGKRGLINSNGGTIIPCECDTLWSHDIVKGIIYVDFVINGEEKKGFMDLYGGNTFGK